MTKSMRLTREERERIKARIGEMIAGEPITDAELENLAKVVPAAFYTVVNRELGITGGDSADDVLRALPDDLIEELQSQFRDFLEQSNPLAPDTWNPEILFLTERLILDGRCADNVTNEKMCRSLFELMSLTYIEWQRRFG
jgi:hypothetical protein